MFTRIKSRWWTRHTEWPYFPISTFPLIPAPLPSKWHMQFLPPLHVYQDHTPQSASDRSVVTAISLKVRIQMQPALDQIVARRRVFWGSVFQ
jgi:hypothetical protein